MFGFIGYYLSKALQALNIFSSDSQWETVTPDERELVQHIQEKLKVEIPVFKEWKGFVTQISNNAIELDHKFNYRLEVNDRFAVGDRVSYKVYKTLNNVVVKDVVLSIEKEKIVNTSVNGTVVKVEGSKYELSNGAVFDLNDVRSEFLPILHDNVCVEGTCPVKKEDDEDFDVDLSTFTIKRVTPSITKLITGVITSFNPVSKLGIVGSDVKFHQNVCDKYTPKVGDNVVCNVLEGRYENDFRWRVESLSLNTTYESNSRHMFVVSPIPRFNVVLGETKIVDLKLSNHSKTVCKILSVTSRTHKNSSLPPDYPEETLIPPQTTVTWPVKVCGEHIGPMRMQFKWTILCHKKTIVCNSFLTYTTTVQDLGEGFDDRNCPPPILIPGQRKIGKPIFRKVPLKDYIVPQSLRDLVENEDNYNNVLEMQIVLQKDKPSLAESLSVTNYDDWMHTLLFLEEVKYVKLYDKLETQDHLYKLRGYVVYSFPLESEYSKIVCGDSLVVSKPWEDISYEGKIWEVSATQIFCKFNPTFEGMMQQGALYDISFKMNRNRFKRLHQAIDIVLKQIGVEWLFPSVILDDESDIPASKIHLNLVNNRLNKEQKNAVKNILAKKNLPYPYIIYGPPGTGKTMTVAELILQVYSLESNSRILVAAPTNSAVDTLGLRLLNYGTVNKQHMVRLSSYNAYSQGKIASQLLDISFVPHLGDPAFDSDPPENRDAVPTIYLSELGRNRITIGTLSTLSILNSVGLEQGFFSHIVIDEAGQCTEPETLLPIALIDPMKTQLVLAGDPMQLGPTIISTLANQYNFNRSFLDRLTSTHLYRKKFDAYESTCGFNSRLIARLVYNYRSLPKIVDLVGELFYNSDLLPVISPVDSQEAEILNKIEINGFNLGVQNTSLLFINVDSRDEQLEGNHSWFNNGEIVQVMNVLNSLYSKGISPDDIGVITPYSLQVKKIYELLDSLKLYSPKVASVEEFQGQERNIIILSLVRNNLGISKKLSPFLCDGQRINVALSRAKVANIIIGNKNTLCAHPMWVNIISKCHIVNFMKPDHSPE